LGASAIADIGRVNNKFQASKAYTTGSIAVVYRIFRVLLKESQRLIQVCFPFAGRGGRLNQPARKLVRHACPIGEAAISSRVNRRRLHEAGLKWKRSGLPHGVEGPFRILSGDGCGSKLRSQGHARREDRFRAVERASALPPWDPISAPRRARVLRTIWNGTRGEVGADRCFDRIRCTARN
jgi:hypothetical protein